MQVYGSRRDRERKAEWIADRRDCEDCYRAELEKKREAELAAAREQAADWELPALEGTEKQIVWAERIRAGYATAVEKVREGDHLERNDEEGDFEAGVSKVFAKSESRFWIDTIRDRDPDVAAVRRHMMEVGRKARIEPVVDGPTVVRPAGMEPISSVEILHVPGEVRLSTSRKECETFIDAIKDIGFRWGGMHWMFDCGCSPVSHDAVAAGIALEVLALGYSAILPQPTVAELVQSGGFERDPPRKLLAAARGRAFLFRWRRSDDIFDTVKSLPGARWDSPYMRVPATSANEVLDLAEQFGFWISSPATKLAESLVTIEVGGETVVLGQPTALSATPLSGGIHADLRDH
ncbi:hypothetical protein [Aureimonas psammosilenae]|uniref:hypothetical protein n=1 Tax=Aureimonas psammosilenae TaxID=2495496 RepID=UPI0012605F19|nr:hypothetical protein [Aureimonas psammosilenae]